MRQKTRARTTALTRYERLECIGLWRDDPQAQRREVVVRLGEATLILSDPRSEVALCHWSLPAVERVNGTALPALYAPGPDVPDSLELTDPDMIAALATVHQAVAAAEPRPGRLRGAIFGLSLAALAGLGMFWLPGAVVRHTAAAVPPALRAEIGQAALDDLIRVTGAPCDDQTGLRALAQLSERVFGPADTPILFLMPEGMATGVALPGGMVALSSALATQTTGPEALAGVALAEITRAAAHDPLEPMLAHAGLVASLRLLTTGTLTEGALAGYAEVLLRTPPPPLSTEALLAAFRAAQVPSAPYGYAIDPSGEASLPLIEGDPFRGLAPAPLIPDDAWVALQGTCG
jgi:hypothetical protein